MTECERRLVARYTVPTLKAGQVHHCKDGGCHPLIIKNIDEWCFRESKGDYVFREDYYTVDVCASCGGDIGVWDTLTDTEVYCNYEIEDICE